MTRALIEHTPPTHTHTHTQIRCHPWFAARLPRYLAVMQADAALSTPRIDGGLVEEVGGLSVCVCVCVCLCACVCVWHSQASTCS